MKCPVCHARNVTAAHIQGHACKGSPKRLTAEQRAYRRAQMLALNAKRKAKSQRP